MSDANVPTVASYSALAEVYDRWAAGNPYDSWAKFIAAVLRDNDVHRVVDVCCGTGVLTRLLQDDGFEVAGVDGSADMLEQARARALPGTDLRAVDLPREAISGVFDAAICTFDSVNYMSADGALAEFLANVGGAVRPGGVFVLDLNTRTKLEDFFGSSHYGDDLGDFAYVWRNRYDADAHTVDFLITLFTAAEGTFVRREERHRQRWFSDAELAEAIDTVGFEVVSDTDDYTTDPVTTSTLRRCMVLRRR